MALLTTREIQVARLVAAGLSYRRIATELRISVPTVQTHVQNAAQKLGGSGSPKVRLIVFVVNLPDDDEDAQAAS